MNVVLQKNKQEEAKKGIFKPKSEILRAIFLPEGIVLKCVLDGKGSIYFIILRYRLFFPIETYSIVIRDHQTAFQIVSNVIPLFSPSQFMMENLIFSQLTMVVVLQINSGTT